MPLILGNIIKARHWKQTNMTLHLSPLYEDDEKAYLKDTTSREFNDEGQLINIHQDYDAYCEKVGLQCIKGWEGEVPEDEKGKKLECNEENIKRFMRVGPAREFVLNEVKSLDMFLKTEVDAAKNA